jgi:hypothetical protein
VERQESAAAAAPILQSCAGLCITPVCVRGRENSGERLTGDCSLMSLSAPGFMVWSFSLSEMLSVNAHHPSVDNLVQYSD